MWFLLWVGLTLFARIANGLRAGACVGSLSGLLGELFFYLARRAEQTAAGEDHHAAGTTTGGGEDTHEE